MSDADRRLIENDLIRCAVTFINQKRSAAEEVAARGIPILPGSLAEALDDLSKDAVLREALGQNLYEAFSRAKWAEWDDYRIHVMDWEIERYIKNF
jgi:glutamine synthetase